MSRPTVGASRSNVVEAVLAVVATRGLERATVREVATQAGVAIGTVQHWFPTKDALLVGAFAEVVDRIRRRVAALDLGSDVRGNLVHVLSELLPLDDERMREARIQVAFAARAAGNPELAELQRAILVDVVDSLAQGVGALLEVSPAQPRAVRAARTCLALIDGLALHAVSSAQPLPPDTIDAVTELVDGLRVVRDSD